MLIEIEVKNPANRALFFKPTQATVRGAIDFAATGDPELYALGMDFNGKAIPGQRIALDLDAKTGLIYDPLTLPENGAVAQKLVNKLAGPVRGSGIKFAEPKKHEGVHPATWLYHMRRAVENGTAVVTKGDIKAKTEGEPQKEFIHVRRPDPQADTIKLLIEQNAKLAEQNAKLMALLSPAAP